MYVRRKVRGKHASGGTPNFTLQFGKIIPVWDKILNRSSSPCLPRGAPHNQFQELFPEISKYKKMTTVTKSCGCAQVIELTFDPATAIPSVSKNQLAYFALQNKTNYNMRANTCTYININYFVISILVC
jgi:hypothetical protein